MTIKAISSFNHQPNTGVLYLVPTPIGNLQDMTNRAITTLKEVDLIAAEDTRNTQKLLNYFEIETPQISFHEHNTNERLEQLIGYLKAGQSLAQVSDAGMPSISDPGKELVAACVENGIPVVPLPGPNAALTGLIASGLVPQPFYFYGFLPRQKKEQKAILAKLNQQECTIILYEAPHRLKKTLKALEEAFGGERKIVLCRELTKRYEEFIRGTLAEAQVWAQENEIRGEFVLLVEGNDQVVDTVDQSQAALLSLTLSEQVQKLIDEKQLKPNAAIKEVAKLNNLARQTVYNAFHEIDS